MVIRLFTRSSYFFFTFFTTQSSTQEGRGSGHRMGLALLAKVAAPVSTYGVRCGGVDQARLRASSATVTQVDP